jgi:hypothetical protein
MIYFWHWLLILILYQGTVWLSCYPLHVHMGRRKSEFAISKGQYHRHLIHRLFYSWDTDLIRLQCTQDGYELRKQSLGQLLTLNENICEDNMPAGVKGFINCIRINQNNMNMKTWCWKAKRYQSRGCISNSISSCCSSSVTTLLANSDVFPKV